MYLLKGAPSLTQVLTQFAAPRPAPALAVGEARTVGQPKASRAAQSPVHLPIQVKVYATALLALALLVLLAWRQVFPADGPDAARIAESSWTLPMVFAGLTTLAILFPIKFTRSYKLNLDGAAHFASLLLFGPLTAMLMAGLGAAVGNVTLLIAGKRDPWNVLFNTGRTVLAIAAAGAVYIALVGAHVTEVLDGGHIVPLLGLIATAVMLYVTNTFPTAVAVGLQHRKDPFRVWMNARRADFLQSAALYLVGLVAAVTVYDRPWTIVVMVMPVAPIYVTLQRTARFLERRVEDQTIAAVEAMADTVDMRDHYTFEHSKRVARYAVQIAESMGLPAKEVETIRLAARVHDLGKIGVPDHVLRKPGPLNAEEWELMERHVQIGYDILSRFEDFRDCRELILLHHERVDGTGYPNAVNERDDPDGYRLLRGAQIIAVADALDAMTSNRPYRQALSLDDTMAEFRRLRGQQWLPEVVDVLEALVAQPEQRRTLMRARLSLVPNPAAHTGFPAAASA